MKTLLFVFALVTSIATAQEIPMLRGHVNDYAGVLTSDHVTQLENKLTQFESATSNQVAILTLASLPNDTIEDFANKVFKTWHLGQKDRNNGILFVNAIGERKIRIEVGYGLEGSLTDAQAKSIILEITPALKSHQMFEAYDQAIDKIIAATKGEYKATSTGKKDSGITQALVLFVLVTIFAGAAHPVIGSAVGGGSGWLIFWLAGYSVILGIALGVVAGLIISVIVRASSGGGGYGGGYSSGGSSWGSGGSSFFGGGGDSGGGGASGGY